MATSVKITNLRFEHHPTGLGVSVSKPRLSWKVVPAGSDIPQKWTQKSYEVEIKRRGAAEAETFPSDGSNTVLVPWPGSALSSRETATVRVRSLGTCEAGDCSTDWSDWKTVEAALFEKSDWSAKTITLPERTDEKHPDENGVRPIRFRKTFTAPDKSNHSRLYITALGLYEAYLNGHRIGDECLAPGWTTYNHRIQFQVFDVASLLQPGQNSLVVEVAEGWYAGRLCWEQGYPFLYGKHIGVFAQLEVFDSADAASPSLTVPTDDSWECRLSPIVASGIYDGETYDLGLEYDAEGTASDGWSHATVIDNPEGELVASSVPPIRVMQTVKPVAITKDPDGKPLVDFGQNLVGRIRIPQLTKPDGHRVVIRYAEVLENGKLGTRPLRDAKATDTIIFGGGKDVTDWTSRFTYHGFRYVDCSGWNTGDPETPLTLDSLVAEVMYTDMARTGHFSCSDEKVTKLHENVVWSMRGNFVGIPTDCPQRDERLGWTGDIQVFSPTASFLYDCGGMLSNWMRDLLAEQKEDNGVVPLVAPNAMKKMPYPPIPQAIWDDVVILVPWTLYRNFGDVEVLRESWQGMKDYLRTLRRGDDGLWDENVWQFGDWLDPAAPPSDPGLASTDGTLVADEYLVHVTSVMSKIATVLELPDEAKSFQDDYNRLKQIFLDKYVAKSGLIVGDSQTSMALALVFDLYDDPEHRRMAAHRLKRSVRYAKFKVSTGFAGTPAILHALAQGGHHNVAYRMLLEEGCPSWLYPVGQGATTIWERWDSMLEDGSINPGSMTSFNHYALGSVANWLHSTVGGLSPLEPGWKRFLVRPVPGGTLTSADARFESPQGEASCSWELGGKDDGTVKVKVTVPLNATAVVEKPDGTVELGSGKHELEWELPKSNDPWPPTPILPHQM